MSKFKERLIKSTGGRFASCEFTKKNGDHRRITFRTGVKKNLKGKGLAFDPAKYNLKVVWDVHKGGYRMIRLDTMSRIRCAGTQLNLFETNSNH